VEGRGVGVGETAQTTRVSHLKIKNFKISIIFFIFRICFEVGLKKDLRRTTTCDQITRVTLRCVT
jgi:hypothetical protein